MANGTTPKTQEAAKIENDGSRLMLLRPNVTKQKHLLHFDKVIIKKKNQSSFNKNITYKIKVPKNPKLYQKTNHIRENKP